MNAKTTKAISLVLLLLGWSVAVAINTVGADEQGTLQKSLVRIQNTTSYYVSFTVQDYFGDETGSIAANGYLDWTATHEGWIWTVGTAYDEDGNVVARWPERGRDEWDVDGVPKFRIWLTIEGEEISRPAPQDKNTENRWTDRDRPTGPPTLTPAQLDAQIAAHNREVDQYERDIAQYEADVAAYERDVEAHNRLVDEWDTDAAEWDRWDLGLSEPLATHNRAVDAYNADVAAHDAEVERHDAEASAYDNDVESYNARLRFFENDVGNYEYDVDQYERAVEAHNARVVEFDNAAAAYESDLAAYEGAVAAYNREVASYESEVQQFNSLPPEQQTEFWYNRLVRWKEELDRRANQLDGIKNNLDQRRGRLINEGSWLDAKKRELDSWAVRLDETLAELQNREANLDREGVALDERMARLNGWGESLDQQLAQLNRRMRDLNRQGQNLDHQLASLDEAGAELDTRGEALDASNAELDLRVERLDERLVELEKRGTLLDQRAEELNALAANMSDVDIDVPQDLRDAPAAEPTFDLQATGFSGEELKQLKAVVASAKIPAAQRWLISVLRYEKQPKDAPGTRSPVTYLRHEPFPTVAVYPRFFELTDIAERQTYLGFEAAKVLYLWKVDRPPTGSWFAEQFDEFLSKLSGRQEEIFTEVFLGEAGGKASLAHIGDRDPESRFGYAFRLAVFQLPPPPGIEEAEWNDARNDFYEQCAKKFFQKKPDKDLRNITVPLP